MNAGMLCLLFLFVIASGCLSPQGHDETETDSRIPFEVAFAKTWETSAGNSYSGVMFSLEEHAKYRVAARGNSTWNNVLAFHMSLQTIEETTPLNIIYENSGRQAETQCKTSRCLPRDFEDGLGFALGGGLGHGTYVVQGLAPGSAGVLNFSAAFSRHPSRLELFEGHAFSLIVDSTSSPLSGPAGEYRLARINWTATGPFYALVQTAGGAGIDAMRNITIDGPGRHQHLFGTGSRGWYLQNATGLGVDPEFPGAAGNWSVSAEVRQPTDANRGPSVLIVSVLEDPPYVRSDGTFVALGRAPEGESSST